MRKKRPRRSKKLTTWLIRKKKPETKVNKVFMICSRTLSVELNKKYKTKSSQGILFFLILREGTEETLLQLLEDTCNKLNAASLAWSMFYFIPYFQTKFWLFNSFPIIRIVTFLSFLYPFPTGFVSSGPNLNAALFAWEGLFNTFKLNFYFSMQSKCYIPFLYCILFKMASWYIHRISSKYSVLIEII